MSAIFEIILFTASLPDYANPIIDQLDPDKKIFSHRFYRQHTTHTENYFIKDLSSIGRDLKKIIIVDD
jgi:CTD small phosphatase-like protein 2